MIKLNLLNVTSQLSHYLVTEIRPKISYIRIKNLLQGYLPQTQVQHWFPTVHSAKEWAIKGQLGQNQPVKNHSSIVQVQVSKRRDGTSSGGTKFATFRIMKASPGWNPRMLEGHTLESAQAITINCSWTRKLQNN